jgi:hypothetical protein
VPKGSLLFSDKDISNREGRKKMRVKGAVASLLAATLIAVLATVTAAADTDAYALALAAGAVAETGSLVSSGLANTEGTKDDPIVIRNLLGEKKQNKKKSKKMKKKGAKKAKKKKGAKKAKKKKGAKKNKKKGAKKGAKKKKYYGKKKKKVKPNFTQTKTMNNNKHKKATYNGPGVKQPKLGKHGIKGLCNVLVDRTIYGTSTKSCPDLFDPVNCGTCQDPKDRTQCMGGTHICHYPNQCVAGTFGWDATNCELRDKAITITMNQLLLDAKKALKQKNLAKQELTKAGDERKKANHTFKYKQKQYKKALKAIDKAKYKHPQWQNRADNALNKQIKALNDAK